MSIEECKGVGWWEGEEGEEGEWVCMNKYAHGMGGILMPSMSVP